MTRTRGPQAVRAEWGRNIAQFREIGGFTSQEALADELGVTQQAVSLWERGVKAPRDEMRARIAKACGIDVAAIFPPIR